MKLELKNFASSLGISCIYKITNRTTGDFYIGQTVNLTDRHRYSSNYKNCTDLFEDIVKYGWFSFDKEVLEVCDPKHLDERELHYINTLKPKYNIRGVGKDNVYAIADVTKKRMSQKKLDDPNLKRQRVKNIDTGEEFDSITAAAASVGATKISISRACKGIYKSSKGFKWEFI